MANRKANTKYALACSRVEHGYGHIIVHVHDLFENGGNGTTIKIACQVGGEHSRVNLKSYAWKHGISNGYDTINTQTAHQGYLLMRRADKALDKVYDEAGSPKTFAEYAVRVLRALGIRKVSVNPKINAGYQDLDKLPKFDSTRDHDELLNTLLNMENELIGTCC